GCGRVAPRPGHTPYFSAHARRRGSLRPISDAARLWHAILRTLQRGQPFPSSSQPNFSRALRATSGLGVLEGGNCSRQCQGLQALISATEWVMSPALRRSGGIAGSALESHEPLMNWIESSGSVRVIISHSIWSRLVTSTSSSHTTMYFDA